MLFKKRLKEESDNLDKFFAALDPAEYEECIRRSTEKETRECGENVFIYISAYTLSRDTYMQNYYLNEIRRILRRGADIHSYCASILFASALGRDNIIEEFMDEMLDKYPLRGALFCLGIPLLRLWNPFKDLVEV